MSIKLLHIYKSFFPETQGGVEQYIYNVCVSLQKYNIQSRILCTSKTARNKTSYFFKGIEVITYPETFHAASCPISLQYLLNFYQEIKWADIIHYHYPWPFADILPLIHSTKIPQITTYHSDIVKQKLLKTILKPIDQMFLGKTDKIIATSNQYASSSKNLIKFKEKVEIVAICLDKNIYPKAQKIECTKIQKKFGTKFLLFIGQLRYYKGLHLLIEALKNTKANLVIIGSGPLEKKIIKEIKSASLDNVHLLGKVDEQTKINYISSCYSVILPSHLRSEAFGISLLEGCMLGKPLISCRIGTGTEYVNKHNYNGLVAEPNIESLSNAINILLRNPTKAKEMGQNSIKRFDKHFSIDLLGKKIHNIIKLLVK